MSDKIYFRSGLAVQRPTLSLREPSIDSDTKEVWIGTSSGNMRIHAPYNKTSFVSAYQSIAQSILAATLTKLLFQTENYDNLQEFNSNTTYTANETGIYLVSTGVRLNVTSGDIGILAVYVNGAEKFRVYSQNAAATGTVHFNGSVSVLLNAGDTVEIYAYNNTAATISTGASNTYLSIVRVA